MYLGGNVTVFVSDMDRSVDFYTSTLGLELQARYGNYWAEVRASKDLLIGLHPASPNGPAPGTPGGMHIGLNLEGSMDDAIKTLTARGIAFEDTVVDDKAGRFAYFNDPDGNRLYLWESSQYARDLEAQTKSV